MSQMLKSSGAMGAATLTSRVLGLVREQVYAAFMGTSGVADAFQMAFTIPSLFRRLLGEGALTAAFIPIFKEKEKTAGEVEMWRAANAVVSGLVVAAASISGLVILGITMVLSSASLGENTRLMLSLLRVMFPYMLLVCLAAVFMGMLNARGSFFVPAMGAAMLNVAMIGSVLFLAPRLGTQPETQVFGLAIGVLIAGVAQAGFQWPSLHRQGYRYQWVAPWHNDTVRQVVRKMLPASVGVAAFQINVLLTQVLAFGTQESIVASFNVAVRLMEFPQGIFGISLATYLLPALAGLAAEKRYPEFRSTLHQGLAYLSFANLIAAALLLALAAPIIRLLFEYGRFDSLSTRKVSVAVACLAPGLLAFSPVNILARAFYALGDTSTPMRISVFCLAMNLLFSFLLVRAFEAAGLAVANSLSSYLNVGLLGYALRRKLGPLELGRLRADLPALLGAAALAGALAWTLASLCEARWGHLTVPRRAGAVFVPMAAAGALYLGISLWARIPVAREIFDLVFRRRHQGHDG